MRHGSDGFSYRRLANGDEVALLDYLEGLSPATRSRFEPHPFDRATVDEVCAGRWLGCIAWVGIDPAGTIVAYAVVKPGHVEFDVPRYAGYAVTLDPARDYSLAPSVADAWQTRGLGGRLMEHVLDDLAARGAHYVALWGGVQADNERAVAYYRKFGFEELGRFEHRGDNIDMLRRLAG